MDDMTMTATFVPSPESQKILDELSAPKAEYVVENPVFIEATTKSGETVRYPTAVRERIVRCRDCRRSFEERGELWCRWIVGPPVEPDGFCAWGERKGTSTSPPRG